MKKALVCAVLVILTFSLGVAEDYWHIKVAPGAVMVIPQDGNGSGLGTGAKIDFGYPKGNLDIGFEIYKWWRGYKVANEDMRQKSLDSLIREGGASNGAIIYRDRAKYDDSGLGFAVTAKYKFINLTDNMGIYSGAGVGLYMFQVKRDELRQNNRTGYYQIQYADYYLATKTQLPMFLGIEGSLMNKISYYAESRITWIPNFDGSDFPFVWDGDRPANSAQIGFGLGLKYNF